MSNMGMSISFLSILGKEALIFPVARGGGRGELAQVHESCLRAREVNKSITLKAIAMPNSATIDWSRYVETKVPPSLPSPLPCPFNAFALQITHKLYSPSHPAGSSCALLGSGGEKEV